ncbi:MAG: 5' nucleotidase, NT5C type [Bacillota bacterium]
MRIGLDLDGVLVHSIPRWIAVLNREAGAHYGPDDLPDTHGSPEQAYHSDRNELEMLILPGPVDGGPQAAQALHAGGHELVVVTARHPRMRGLTQAWLDYHGVPIHRLHFLEGASKAPTALAEGLDCMVEDAPHNALALAEAGVPVLLFGRPYNRDLSHPLIHRCDGWAVVLEQIRSGSLPGRPSQRFPA